MTATILCICLFSAALHVVQYACHKAVSEFKWQQGYEIGWNDGFNQGQEAEQAKQARRVRQILAVASIPAQPAA